MDGRELRVAREAVGMTPTTFAGLLGVSERQLYRYETGEAVIKPVLKRAIRNLLEELAATVSEGQGQAKVATSRRPSAARNSSRSK